MHSRGLVVDALSTVYVSDQGNCRVVRWPKGATEGSVVLGGSDPGECISPDGLSFDRHDNLYFADTSHNQVQKFLID